MNKSIYFSISLSFLFLISCQTLKLDLETGIKQSISQADTIITFSVGDQIENLQADYTKVYHSFRFGKIQKTQGYLNGRALNGPYEELYHKKPIVSGAFKNGLKEGKWLKWDNEGMLLSSVVYKSGKMEGEYALFTDKGELEEKGSYKDGLKHGKVQFFREEGLLELKYKNDVPVDTLNQEKKPFFSKFSRKSQKD